VQKGRRRDAKRGRWLNGEKSPSWRGRKEKRAFLSGEKQQTARKHKRKKKERLVPKGNCAKKKWEAS